MSDDQAAEKEQLPHEKEVVDVADKKIALSTQVEQARAAVASMVAPSASAHKKKTGEGTHVFWDTQPVPRINAQIEDARNEAMEPDTPHDQIRKDPYNLPDMFEWTETDVNDDAQLKEVYTLLNENYVDDDDNMFRFDYSKEFLRWALQPPHYYKSWHIGVRVKASKKLVAFITGIPATIKVEDKRIKLTEINFLCVHKKLRDKRLAPVLIKEVTRRVHLQGMFQAVYTAGVVLPKPVSRCRYYHRSLNPKKLIEVGFSHLGPRMTMSRLIKLNALPDRPSTPGIRELQRKDVPEATALLATYLNKYRLAATFNEEEFEHWFMPRRGIINCFVVEDPKTHKLTDMVSFYTLPSTVLNNKSYTSMKAAYSFYNVATQTPLIDLMNDALILAKKLDFDVFNCLDLFENQDFIKELKFGQGDGCLQYYLYNWITPEKQPRETGIVLL
jgi:glycylpeptide N-tetradecanoyltransferase